MASVPMSSRVLNRPVKTCTECKQVKLRCDSRAMYPAPCTRCSTRRLQCIVDASFRRTPARKRVEDMARELEALKNQSTAEGGPTISPSTADIDANSSEYGQDYSGVAVVDKTGLTLDYFQLGSFHLDRETIIDCFKLFAGLLYPHFPILDPNITIASIHSSSPLLFWTIIAIVLQNEIKSTHASFEELRASYVGLLGSEILKAPLPLQTIQALAYLIMWPFGVEKQPQDPSWLYCGIAVNASLSAGLHNSKLLQSMRNMDNLGAHLRVRATTWLGCFFASTTLGMFTGIPPSITGPSDLETIEQFVRQYSIPPEFAYQVMVQHTLAKFTSVLLENSKEGIYCSLVNLVESELNGLKSQFLTEWTARVEVSLLVAKLHLYTMTVPRMQSDFTSREVLLKSGLSVSLRIIYLCDKGVAFDSDCYPDITIAESQRTIPKNLSRGLALAAIFLLRHFALNNQVPPEEQELARNHVAIAHAYFKTGSTAPLDERARVARLLETLGRQTPVDIDNAKLKVDNRMGWSLVADSLEIGQEIRRKSEQNTPEQSNSVEIPVIGYPNANEEPANQGPATFDVNLMGGYEPMDFQLPDDIWGDSLWGNFDFSMPPAPFQH